MKRLILVIVLSLLTVLPAAVPQLINYQGRVAVGTVNFDGSGQFKFALVNAAGSMTYWSNDGTSTAGSEPTAAVTRTVTKGLYSVQLGDTTLANMTSVPTSVFDNADVRLRVWFNDGTNGFQLLTPDQRLTSVGFAMKAGSADTAATVPDGAITAAKLATGAVSSTKLASGLTLGGTTSGTFSGNGAGLTSLSGTSITTGTLSDARLSSNVALLNRGTQTFSGTTNTFSGRVGIGAAPDANHSTLSVTSSAPFQLDLGTAGGTTTGKMMRLGYNQTGDFAEIMSVHSGVSFKNLVMLKDGGNVGIGTSTATSKLVVAANTTASTQQLVLQGASDPNKQLMVGYNTTDNYGSIQPIVQGTGFTNLNLNPNGGNVGIGKTDPAYKLDVNGVVNVTAVRFPDGSILRSAVGIGDPPIGTVTYTAAGTYSWVAPANATSVYVDLVGGGGGGAGGGAANDAVTVTHTVTNPSYTGTCKMGGTGGGGGGGGNKQHFVYMVTPGATYTIVVGAGGAGGALGQPGAAGGVTSFSLAATTIATAPGGSGGSPGAPLPGGIPFEGTPITGGAGGAGGVSGTVAPNGDAVAGTNGATGISGSFSDMARDAAIAQTLLSMTGRRFFCGPWINQRDASAAGGITTGAVVSTGGAGGQGASRQSTPGTNQFGQPLPSIADDPGTAGSAGTAGGAKLVIY